ncbi:MAG: hypothetical protein KBD36_02810 [Alphaproteobacteria bacterium]|nr:hypothetical protein [Alphaproteobacteria bacterium]MBP9776756.1 hypothetical protein [Alphaproteobacteria bacterium]
MASYNMKIERAYSQSPITVQSDDEQVSVIRKEFVDLTGDHFSAAILNQLLYWTLRVKDFDLFLKEEKALGSNIQSPSIHPESHEPSRHGWIYKTAPDLSEETLLGISKTTMRKYLKLLIDQGWIEERINSLDKWNKTTQYRVNIRNLQADLMAIGRHLPSVYLKAFSAALGENHPHKHLQAVSWNENASSIKNRELAENSVSVQSNIRRLPSITDHCDSDVSNLQSGENTPDLPLTTHPKSEEISKAGILSSKTENLPSEAEVLPSETKILSSKTRILPSYTYTETTSKITNKEHTQRTRAREDFDKIFFEEVLGVWKTCTHQEVHLTEERNQKLQSVLSIHFQNDLSQWKQFCERVGSSPFLMGYGPRKWRVSLDWVLCEENLLKVLEGNFDDPEGFDQKQADQHKADREKEISTILGSIEDPVWKKWCSQLDLSIESRDSVSLWELKEIAHARFLEVEGNRLVWIGSSDPKVLSRIEDLKLKILPIVQRNFPHARTVRTRLVEEDLSLQREATHFHPLPTKLIQQEGGFAHAQ